MRILITGADGFVGKNLGLRLSEMGYADIVRITRGTTREALRAAVDGVDFAYHLAGVNRPEDPAEFKAGNTSIRWTNAVHGVNAGNLVTLDGSTHQTTTVTMQDFMRHGDDNQTLHFLKPR